MNSDPSRFLRVPAKLGPLMAAAMVFAAIPSSAQTATLIGDFGSVFIGHQDVFVRRTHPSADCREWLHTTRSAWAGEQQGIIRHSEISIGWVGPQRIITWPCGGTLYCAPGILGPWTPVPDATSPYVIPPDGTGALYQIKH